MFMRDHDEPAFQLGVLGKLSKNCFLRFFVVRKHVQEQVLQFCTFGYLAEDPPAKLDVPKVNTGCHRKLRRRPVHH